MISLRVFFFVTLALPAVRGFDYRAQNLWGSPVYFFYIYGDTLDINVTLRNVPPGLTVYKLLYQTENCGEHFSLRSSHMQQGSQCNVSAGSGTILPDRAIHISQKLIERSVIHYIELRYGKNDSLCSTKRIMEGIRDDIADALVFRQACLNNNYERYCQIDVNFENKCDEQKFDAIKKKYCTQSHGFLTCESADLPDDTVHQWYQRYRDGSFSGIIPPVRGRKSKFIMGFLKFDERSFIYSRMISTLWKKEWVPEIFKISVNEYKEYDVEGSKTYSELEQVNFACLNYAFSQIGWIDPTGSEITTYNATSYSWTFKKTDNNSMLCCINYNTYNKGHEMVVERSVNDITVLIYKEPEKQDNAKGPAGSPVPVNKTINDFPGADNKTSDDTPGADNKTINDSPGADNKTSDDTPGADNKTSDDTPGADNKTSDDTPGADNKTNDDLTGAENKASDESIVTVVLIIVLAVVLGVAAMLGFLVTLLVIKYRRVKSNTGELPQTYVPNNPFYVNLLFRRECQQEIHEREHIYEEIN